MSNQERNSITEGRRIGNELRHHEFSQAHKELSYAVHGDSKSFEHVLKGIREGLHGDQSHLSVDRDKHNNVTHINFENHDIYGGKSSHGHAGHHNNGREFQRVREKADHAGSKHAHSEHGRDAHAGKDGRLGQGNFLGHELHAMVDIVKRLGKEMGLSRAATTGAVAAMLEESGGNPTKVGDHGASVGLFQLNFHGGEGTESGISKQQASDPEINARIALRYFKEAQYRSSNPVEIAKLAQRAGDKNYFHKVGQHLQEAEHLVREEYV